MKIIRDTSFFDKGKYNKSECSLKELLKLEEGDDSDRINNIEELLVGIIEANPKSYKELLNERAEYRSDFILKYYIEWE